MTIRRAFVGTTCGALGLLATGIALWASHANAQDEQVTVTAKGRIAGGKQLLNPVWNEAKDPKNHRYTFRQPSTTVGKSAKTLSAYLPKEVCIAALGADKAEPQGIPIQIHVSGGRTTPVTVVVAEGQNVQFINHDPFPHKLFSVEKGNGSLGPEQTKAGEQRTWQPPKAGTWEIRDALSPSVRSWIVVESRAAGSGYPNVKNEFLVKGLKPGAYELRAYFSGKPIGKPVTIELRPSPDVQQFQQPVVLTEKKSKGQAGNEDKE